MQVTGRRRAAPLLAGIGAVAVLLVADPAAAQEPSPDGLETPSDGDIVVTAQRREQELRDVPIAVTAVGSETISDLNLRNVDAVASVTPGVVLDTAFSFPTFFIRGVGAQNRAGVGLETPVAIYVDGAYNPRNAGTPFDLYDMASVEVLKGPQGTLFGRNASGGAILMRTADPEFRTAGRFAAEAGNFGHRQLDAMINVPLGETLALRVAGRLRDDDGFVVNRFDGRKLRGRESGDIRAKLLWEPSDGFRNLLSVDYHRDTGEALTVAREDAFDGSRLIGFREVDSDFVIKEPAKGVGINLNSSVELGDITLTNIFSYRHLSARLSDDNDHGPLPLVAINATWGGDTFSNDFQIASDWGGTFDFLAGVLYSQDKADSDLALYGAAFGLPYSGDTIPAGATRAVQKIRTEAYGAFLETYIRPADGLTLTLGGRLSRDVRRVTASSPASYTQRYSDTVFTPRAVIAYDLGQANIYASYTRGYLAGGFTIPSFGPGNVLRPEKIDSFELGLKFTSDDTATRANLALYRYNYNDVLVTLCCVASQAITENAARARGSGIELDVSHKFAPGITFGLGGSYTDAKFRDFPAASVFVPVYGDPAQPGVVTTVVTQTADLGGTRLPRAPKWTGYATLAAAGEISDGWRTRLSGVVRYSSRFLYTQGSGGPLNTDVQKAFTTVNMSAAIIPPGEHFEIGVYADNLTNTHYYANRAIGAFGLDSRIAKPRSYGVRLSYEF